MAGDVSRALLCLVPAGPGVPFLSCHLTGLLVGYLRRFEGGGVAGWGRGWGGGSFRVYMLLCHL